LRQAAFLAMTGARAASTAEVVWALIFIGRRVWRDREDAPDSPTANNSRGITSRFRNQAHGCDSRVQRRAGPAGEQVQASPVHVAAKPRAGQVLVRDSKDPDGPVLAVKPADAVVARLR
jgi:uncharacterized protein DUF397